MGGRLKTAEEQGARIFFFGNIFGTCEAAVTDMTKRAQKEPKDGDGKEPRKLTLEDWEVKARGVIFTLEIRKVSLTGL